jgi:hypothetical protein
MKKSNVENDPVRLWQVFCFAYILAHEDLSIGR